MYRWQPKKPQLLRVADCPETAIEGTDSEDLLSGSQTSSTESATILAKDAATGKPEGHSLVATRRKSLSRLLQRQILQTVSARAADARRLGYLLIDSAERAYDVNDIDTVEAVSRLLTGWGFSGRLNVLGSYYSSLALLQPGQPEQSRERIGQLFRSRPPFFKSKALLAISAGYAAKGENDAFLAVSREASHASTIGDTYNLRSFVIAERNTAMSRSISENDHRGALIILERSLPVARFLSRWQPSVYYEHLNSLAVELAEVGRLEEAQRCIAIPLGSSVARFSKDWLDTEADIKARIKKASRSKVSIGVASAEAAPQEETATAGANPDLQHSLNCARVIDIRAWRSGGSISERLMSSHQGSMSTRDKLFRIVDLLSRDDTS